MRSRLARIVLAIAICTTVGCSLAEMVYDFGGSSAYSGGGNRGVNRDADFDAERKRWEDY